MPVSWPEYSKGAGWRQALQILRLANDFVPALQYYWHNREETHDTTSVGAMAPPRPRAEPSRAGEAEPSPLREDIDGQYLTGFDMRCAEPPATYVLFRGPARSIAPARSEACISLM